MYLSDRHFWVYWRMLWLKVQPLKKTYGI